MTVWSSEYWLISNRGRFPEFFASFVAKYHISPTEFDWNHFLTKLAIFFFFFFCIKSSQCEFIQHSVYGDDGMHV